MKLKGEWFEDHGDEDGAQKVTPKQADALAILTELEDRYSILGPVTRDQYARALKRKSWGPENPDSWRGAFRDVLKALQEKHLIHVAGNEIATVES